MPLAPGARIGGYDVIALIGEGGMGQVYRARDARLGRDVAIKVLPASLAADAERIARFEREAKTLAALNHSNIAYIHGVEESNGLTALVMELVEGPTLADRIAQGPIPVDEALPIAKQITDALEAAHELGIVHRDLKPANIKIRRDGILKVLDFGLAKVSPISDASLEAPRLSHSPTITSPAMATHAGMILGTAAYMSPEQARGKPVDRRADIWAFGCVLFEMLTGRRAFEDEDVSLTLSKVLQREPDFDALPSSVPARIRQTLRVCLRKDPRQRAGDIRDVRLALEGAFESVVDQTRVGAVRRSASSRLWIAAAALSAAAAVTMAVIHFREVPPRPATLRYHIPAPEKEVIVSFALSPDGRQLAFTTGPGPVGAPANNRLWVRPLDSLDAQPLRGTEGAFYPFWSPDSRTIGFFAGDKLKKVGLLGGPPQIVCEAQGAEIGAQMGSWNQEGVILFTSGRLIHQVRAAGGEARPVTAVDASRQEVFHVWPRFLPDGRHFLYTAASAVAENSAVYMASLDSQETKRLLRSNATVAYTEDVTGQGYVLFLRELTLMSQRLDAARLELLGEPFPVAENVATLPVGFRGAALGLLAQFSSSAGGVLSYRHGGTALVELVWFDRAGRRLSTVGPPAEYSNLALSPDERRLAISRLDSKIGSRDIWVVDLDRGVPTRLTFDRGDDMNPVWSPDGKRIGFSSSRKGPRDLYVKDANGASDEQVLFASGDAKSMTDWSADGRHVLFNAVALPLDGERKPVPLPRGTVSPRISPNGRWLVYESNESGRIEIYVQSFPALLAGRSEGKWQISTEGGRYPEWRRDGQEVFYVAPDGRLMAVSVTASGPAIETTPPTPLFSVRLDPAGRRAHFQPAANGQRFLVAQLLEQATLNPVTVVVNWASGMER